MYSLSQVQPAADGGGGTSSVSFSHPLIPYSMSRQLGVGSRRQDVLRRHSHGIAFGQREPLTNRIRRILDGYPCDKEILKELLQNADDAGATEIHFVKVAAPPPPLLSARHDAVIRYDTDTRCYSNVRSKADMSQLNLKPTTKKCKNGKKLQVDNRYAQK